MTARASAQVGLYDKKRNMGKQLFDKDAAVIAREKKMERNLHLIGKTIEIIDPEQPPIMGQVVEAYHDALGVVNLVKIIREDGKVEWHEVQTASMTIIPLLTKWIFPLYRWIRDRIKKRRAKRGNK